MSISEALFYDNKFCMHTIIDVQIIEYVLYVLFLMLWKSCCGLFKIGIIVMISFLNFLVQISHFTTASTNFVTLKLHCDPAINENAVVTAVQNVPLEQADLVLVLNDGEAFVTVNISNDSKNHFWTS